MIEKAEKDPSAECLQELRLIVHKLAGNSGMYGYPEVSLSCKRFEEEIVKSMQDKSSFHGRENLQAIQKGFSTVWVKKNLFEKIVSHQARIGVVGMGYIGLSLIHTFGKKGFSILGYDCNVEKIHALQQGKLQYNYVDFPELVQWIQKGKFSIASDPSILQNADVIIISVCTPLDHHKLPNLVPVEEAFHRILSYLKKGCLIILQSTTYPGMTQEELLPLIEQSLGWKVGEDFFLAYVPEISDPGNLNYVFEDVPRMIGGITPACLEVATVLYQKIGCTSVPCSSTKIAEAAKLLQNSYRLVNISLINEMKIMFDQMGIDVWEVIEAASSKPFGFTPFYPGPGIGGDCIAVVPVYLSWKAQETDAPTSLIDLAMKINFSIPHYVVEKIIDALGSQRKSLQGAHILMLGLTYKKDVSDIRESASIKILSLLQKKSVAIAYHDPYIPYCQELSLASISLASYDLSTYDAVVVGVDHSCYDWEAIAKASQLIIDTRNVMSTIAIAQKKTIKA